MKPVKLGYSPLTGCVYAFHKTTRSKVDVTDYFHACLVNKLTDDFLGGNEITIVRDGKKYLVKLEEVEECQN